MLDQNTDRMWFVIGAVIVGAAIIFIANGTLPELFASVTDSFEDVTKDGTSLVTKIGDSHRIKNAEFGEDVELILTLDPVPGLSGWYGSSSASTSVNSLPEMRGSRAIRVSGFGGSTTLKSHRNIYLNSAQEVGRMYIYDVEVKNINDEVLIVTNNKGGSQRLAPGEYAVVRLTGGGSGAHLQLQLHSEKVDGTVEAIVGRLDLGVFVEW